MYASDHRTNPASALLHQRVLTLWLRSERMAWSFLCAYDAAYWTTLHECLQHPAVGQVAAGTGHYTLYAHDWRAVPPRTWLETIDFMALAPAPATEETPRFTVLSREQFDAAVHEALRSWRRPDVLAASPLLGTRMVAQATPDSGSEVNTLRDLLAEAVDDLHTASPKFHRVLAATYFHGASTQEAAAERLNLPFSTYRRHLRRATDLVSENLWRRELNGSAAGGTGPGD
ncbi:hypothetical protein HNP84_010374 [Thermocatellispora tengchongensis]|uniref:Uncharacterized protein n=1 Tax=Thermocatellispora tengchongensis TaxID=1073253 RepID=A0A840PGR3_9ACTN|nr:hypothetical protein [Thermocatellispora tengchongensis]MBB5140604.1 hypothetical protein [Thermocatellispora tengchongensis]